MAFPLPTPPSSSPFIDRTNTGVLTPPGGNASELTTAELQTQITQLKNDYAALQIIAANKTNRGRKRKRDSPNDNDNDSSNTTDKPPDFHEVGRTIARHIGSGIFEDFGPIIRYGLNRDTGLTGDEAEETPANKRLGEAYDIFWQSTPGLHATILSNFHNFKFLNALARSINAGIESVRSDDSGTLRYKIHQWISLLPATPAPNNTADSIDINFEGFDLTIFPNANAALNKDLPGFNDAYYGMLLLPLEYKNNDKYPNPVEGVRSGLHALDGSMLPCFMYPFGQQNDITALRNFAASPIMLRSAKAILQGPSSALKSDGYHAGRKAIAKIIDCRTITPRIIAYLACQVRFALSSLGSWNRWEGQFDYEKFFWAVMTELERPNLRTRTIAMYNRAVFGDPAGRNVTNDATTVIPTAAPTLSNMERLRAEALANGEDDDPA